MTTLFISRKSIKGVGGLARFTLELYAHLGKSDFLLSPDTLFLLFSLPFKKIGHIHLCDASQIMIGVILKIYFRCTLSVTVHGLDLVYGNSFYQFMLKSLLPRADAIIAVSQPVRKLLAKYDLSDTPVYIIPNGISTDHLRIQKPMDLPFIKNKTVLLTVGNLVARKGHAWFIEKVMTRLPREYMYFIVGAGEERSNVLKLLKSLKLEKRVYLFGRISDAQLAYIYKRADVYVCPNIHIEGDFEGFGIAVGEAAAMGLPVVASSVDGLPAVIKSGKNGWLVLPDGNKLLKSLESLKDRKLRKEMGKKARVFTRKNFSWDKTSANYSKLWTKLVTWGNNKSAIRK